MHELMFQAGVKGMSERSELIPCIYNNILQYCILRHALYRSSVRLLRHFYYCQKSMLMLISSLSLSP